MELKRKALARNIRPSVQFHSICGQWLKSKVLTLFILHLSVAMADSLEIRTNSYKRQIDAHEIEWQP